MPDGSRPELRVGMTGAELLRWYWLRTELADFARTLGLRATGGKQELTVRIVAALDGQPAPAVRQRPTGRQLSGDLTVDTVIPVGQRNSQALRAFFVAQVGPAFRFDGEMRAFLESGAGRTLGDAVDHWFASRSRERTEIGVQFELNRFTRQWHRDHPDGTRAELLDAWRRYRSLPTDARGRV